MLGLIIPLGVPNTPDNSLPGGLGQPPRPDNTLPGGPGGRPDNTLPGGQGGRPDNTLPGSQPGIDNTLPGGGDDAWVLAYSPRSGYHWLKFSGGHISGQPVPPTGSTQPTPPQPPTATPKK